jgi:uncharacterized protein (DUF2141 family)
MIRSALGRAFRPILLGGVILLGGAMLPARDGWAADLTVTVENVRQATGSIYFALFRSAENWPDGDKAEIQARIEAAAPSLSHVFHGLAPGRYALGVYHDVNGNGRLDKNFLGIPTEPYAISNNLHPVLAPPRFDDAVIDVPAAGLQITVTLID